MIKILVVDDDKFERDGIIYLLNRLGEKYTYDYYIKDVRNGRLALDLLEKENFDIVITDIKMPVMDGISFLEKAIKIREDIIYIIYSGYNDFEYAKKAMHLNVMDFLVKPVKEVEFNEIIKKAILKVYSKIKESIRYKLLSLYYKRDSLYKINFNFLHSIKGRLLYVPTDKRSLDIYAERLEKLDKQNTIINIEDKGKIIWLNEKCSKKENIENNIRYIFSGLDEIFIVSKKILSVEDLEKQYVKILEYGDKIAVRDSMFILYVRDIDAIESKQGEFNEEIFDSLKYLSEKNFLTLNMKKYIFSNIDTNLIKNKENFEKIILESKNINEIEDFLKNYKNDNEIIVKVKSYISKNYMKDILIGDIADSIFLNSGYLCTLFKKETGNTLINYITEYRLKKAMELLKIKEMKISEISLQVGYSNISYFNSIFRKKTGLTPKEYRKKIYEN